MPQTTIIVAEISEKNGWYNLKSNTGMEISVMQTKCPKLSDQLKDAKPGSEVTGNLVQKEGKNYLWDLDEKKGGFGGGNKSFAPKDKGFEASLQAANTVGAMLALTSKDITLELFDKFFDHVHAKIMSKATAPAAEPTK